MVLKNSKWDKKAKYKFMKKHGIVTKKEPTAPLAKWSSKKHVDQAPAIILQDSDDEWDSETDDALVNHFYPELGLEVTKDQKIKIKQQILQELADNEQQAEQDEEQQDEQEVDGIYLGKEPPQETKKDPAPLFNINDLLKPGKKNRKVLNNKMTDNFLEEYGLQSYDEITHKQDDYNDVYYSKRSQRHINEIPAAELDGFTIGESSLAQPTHQHQQPKLTIRVLSQQELDEQKDRQVRADQSHFYNLIKKRFTESGAKPAKVLEINNFDLKDESALHNLNSKLINAKQQSGTGNVDDDLDFILGEKLTTEQDVDTIMADLTLNNKPEPPKKTHLAKHNTPDDGFLDDLLG